MRRGDAEATLRAAQALIEVSRRLRLPNYLGLGDVYSGWAGAWLGNGKMGIAELRQTLTEYMRLGNKLGIPLLQGKVAEIEANVDHPEKPWYG
jgi:hypothetical protein